MGELRLGDGLNLSVDSQLIEAVAWKHVDDLSGPRTGFCPLEWPVVQPARALSPAAQAA